MTQAWAAFPGPVPAAAFPFAPADSSSSHVVAAALFAASALDHAEAALVVAPSVAPQVA